MYSIDKIMAVDESRVRDIEMYLSVNNDRVVNDPYLYAAAYALYLFKSNDMVKIDELEKYIQNELDDTRKLFLTSILKGNYSFVESNINRFSEIEIIAFILRFAGVGGLYSGEQRTPESLIKLALEILQIKDKDSVADFGSGIGGFLCQASLFNSKPNYYGVELNTTSIEISRIRAELISDKIELEQRDMFELDSYRSFDKIFSNYPFGVRLKGMHSAVSYLEELQKDMPEIKNVTSSDWLFNLLLINCLSKNGKAVAVMTNGSAWNSIDRNIREYFITKGYIEAVISLPVKLFDYSSIPTMMIVLSRGNKSIRMVDARELCETGRRQNILTDENIGEIVRLLSEDGDCSALVNNKEFKDIDYVLNPLRFTEKELKIKDGVPFESIIKRITRGAQIKATDLDEMVSDEPTNNQYLMLANIQNGIISEDLPYLQELDPRMDKYLIKNNNLLMSKNGAPFKIAVAEVNDGQKVLGNGNLFIIELDEEKANPYFIKAFFESEVGALSLKNIAVGSAMPNISTESLKKLIVPLPPIEEQNMFAEKYMAKIDEVKILQTRLQKAMNSLKNMYEEE